MSSIRLGTSISSLLVQRNLATATFALQTSYERLSSGLRINSAKDDAAGLALAQSLNADSKIYTQAIRNINDGISLLNIADAALEELSNILIRQAELAQQAANSTNSREQRLALHEEANALVDEFNRIISSTEFNTTKLFQNTPTLTSIQAGGSNNDTISFILSQELSQTVGDGTFSTTSTVSGGGQLMAIENQDLNSDGISDLIIADEVDDAVRIALGNGDGSFCAAVSYASGDGARTLTIEDFNNDGLLDIVTGDGDGGSVSILLGNGDGTFNASTSFVFAAGPRDLVSGDFDNDGNMDLLVSLSSGHAAVVLYGNGDGSFGNKDVFQPGSFAYAVEVGDFNQDGFLDFAAGFAGQSMVSIFLNNGDGTFSLDASYGIGDQINDIVAVDINYDGILDLLTADRDDAGVSVLLGKEDGTFDYQTQISVGVGPYDISVDDFNGDGLIDFATANRDGDGYSIALSQGNGNFQVTTNEVLPVDSAFFITTGDFNNDEVSDFALTTITGGTPNVVIALGNSTSNTGMAYVNLTTQPAALTSLSTIENIMQYVASERANVGAVQSRFAHTINNLQAMRDEYTNAYSQIMDVDVAREAAELVRNQILQQAAAAVLAQANQESQIALQLLTTS